MFFFFQSTSSLCLTAVGGHSLSVLAIFSFCYRGLELMLASCVRIKNSNSNSANANSVENGDQRWSTFDSRITRFAHSHVLAIEPTIARMRRHGIRCASSE